MPGRHVLLLDILHILNIEQTFGTTVTDAYIHIYVSITRYILYTINDFSHYYIIQSIKSFNI